MSSKPWLSIIGIDLSGWSGLSPAARAVITDADLIVGGARHLDMVPASAARRLQWKSPLSETISLIEAARCQNVVVIATGDPLDYGIGVTLLRHFPANEVMIAPALGAFTLAAARMGWPRQGVECITLHGRPLDRLRRCLSPGARILALSHDGETPAKVAKMLATSGWGESGITALTDMGGESENQITDTAVNWAEQDVGALNTLAITCIASFDAKPLPRTPGLPDDAFLHDGKLTKRVVRASTLAKLAPFPADFLWDIGAGSGAIAIEWLRAAESAKAVAIEPIAARALRIEENARALGVPELQVSTARAPAGLKTLNAPDAVFIGGGLSEDGLLAAAWTALKPKGRIVANAVTLEGEQVLNVAHKTYGGELERIGVEQAASVGQFHGWRPSMTVTQWHVTKGGR
jgi:precorrin-6B C5,15-methyltransferase / cobalt-precorrin-6B C5,C15-methyltransferase